jgi:hypothetical protein
MFGSPDHESITSPTGPRRPPNDFVATAVPNRTEPRQPLAMGAVAAPGPAPRADRQRVGLLNGYGGPEDRTARGAVGRLGPVRGRGVTTRKGPKVPLGSAIVALVGGSATGAGSRCSRWARRGEEGEGSTNGD